MTDIKKQFTKNDLDKDEQKDYDYARNRIQQMQEYRKQSHFGVKLEDLWAEADRAYIPHRLQTTGKRVIATDEEKGWRGNLVTLGETNWQSDISQANPFIKISTAQAILIDQNPGGTFTPTTKKYEGTTQLIKQLYQRSWEYAKSKQQLKLFIHNLSKYGWAVARTYPLKITRKTRVPIAYDEDAPDKTKYKTKEAVEYNDIFRENLDIRNTWMDDMAKPNNEFSIRDWCYRKIYSREAAEEEFSKYKNWGKYTIPQGITTEVIGVKNLPDQQLKEQDLVEFYFYENRLRDLFIVFAGGPDGVPIVISPLPVSDEDGVKKLTLWQTYWNLRHSQSPYGIGIYEAIRYDNAFLDRIRNMTVDQVTLMIYKMFFYTGTQALSDTGEITIKPGVGKQVLNPKDIKWLEVPGPGADAYKMIEMFKKDLDDASGITATLEGEIVGKTAFEIAQAKESALKRLRVPLENVLDALTTEGYITISLIQLLYSIPEVIRVTDQSKIDAYMNAIQSDSELYRREVDDQGEEKFDALVYPEFPLNLEQDDKGNLVETQDTKFFRIKPSGLKWDGIIAIEPQSLLTPSKQVEKALNMELYNILIPLFAQPPELYLKVAKAVIKDYEKDPEDILPDAWLNPPQQNDSLFVPAQEMQTPQMGQQQGQVPAKTLQPAVSVNQPSSLVGRMVNKITKPFRGV